MATGQVAFLSAHLPASILRVLLLIPITAGPVSMRRPKAFGLRHCTQLLLARPHRCPATAAKRLALALL